MKKILLFTFIFVLLTGIKSFSQDELLIDGEPCGIHGNAKLNSVEYRQNAFKNRYSFPAPQDIDKSITMERLLQGGADENRYSQNQAAEIIGYVFDVKTGGVETCNCKTKSKNFRDTHIEITPNSNENDPSKRVIVEMTPRIRQLVMDKGIDWSTDELKNLKGHMVKIQGYMFYDSSHQNEAYSIDPNNSIGKNNWRATCWEIHPVTNIELLDAVSEEYPVGDNNLNDNSAPVMSTFNAPNNPTNNPTNNNITMQTPKTPQEMLSIILIAAILGMVGQGIRVVVGMKKVYDSASDPANKDKKPTDLIEYKRMALSLFLAFAVGCIAGVLALISNFDTVTMNKSTIIAFITAGYVGTDFIEGVFRKEIKK